jgi:XTP/dITP diphosphohydrolase
MKLVLATRNIHKTEEIKYFLHDLQVEVLTLRDFPAVADLVEDGTTFLENSLKKARQVYKETGLTALADDSGLEVFYLANAPGVFSARYAGDKATYAMNNKKLLTELKGVAPRRRRARFVCVLSLVGKNFEESTVGYCPGSIGIEPQGSNGFGYDPLFHPDGFDRTYAQLTFEEKARISHRAKAFELMREKIVGRLKKQPITAALL